MAPVCNQCKQAISSLYPGRPIDHEWRHIPPCPKPAQRTGPPGVAEDLGLHDDASLVGPAPRGVARLAVQRRRQPEHALTDQVAESMGDLAGLPTVADGAGQPHRQAQPVVDRLHQDGAVARASRPTSSVCCSPRRPMSCAKCCRPTRAPRRSAPPRSGPCASACSRSPDGSSAPSGALSCTCRRHSRGARRGSKSPTRSARPDAPGSVAPAGPRPACLSRSGTALTRSRSCPSPQRRDRRNAAPRRRLGLGNAIPALAGALRRFAACIHE